VAESDDLTFEQNWRAGDIVTRDGSDEHEILSNNSYDLITVRCVVAPRDGWCAVGEEEVNLASRYNFVRREHKHG